MNLVLRALRKKAVIGFVGGSDLGKIKEQLAVPGSNGEHLLSISRHHLADVTCSLSAIEDFDYAFAENGLTAFKLGKPLESQSFIKYVGEERYKKMVNFILHYIADMDIPIKR